MKSDFLCFDDADRELYSKIRNKELLFEDLSIAQVIRLTSYINSEIDKKMTQLENLCRNK